MKKCVYCSREINENSVVDICNSCMLDVWGPKMAETIISNMEKQREKGELDLWKKEN